MRQKGRSEEANHTDVVYPPLWKTLWERGAGMTGLLMVGAVAALAVLVYLYGFLRAGIAAAMFLGIVLVGTRFVRQMVVAPPEPEVTDVSEYGLKYVCENCGLELRVEKAARDRPPSHCTEPMKLVREGGKPPLRPL